MPSSRILWVLLQPTPEAFAQIPQGERARRALGDIGSRQPMEGMLAEYGAQPREVVIERTQSAIPIASAVDFQALQGSEPAVRRDEFSGLDFHWPPVRRFRSYSIGTRERLHDRRHHSPLQFEERHKPAVAGA